MLSATNASLPCRNSSMVLPGYYDRQVRQPTDLPVGLFSGKRVQRFFMIFSAFPFMQISSLVPRRLTPLRGAYRDRHGRGVGCGGRGGAFDEQRQERTEKSCGPDASWLAFKSLRSELLGGDGDKKS